MWKKNNVVARKFVLLRENAAAVYFIVVFLVRLS